jgi:hypothetical protein
MGEEWKEISKSRTLSKRLEIVIEQVIPPFSAAGFGAVVSGEPTQIYDIGQELDAAGQWIEKTWRSW